MTFGWIAWTSRSSWFGRPPDARLSAADLRADPAAYHGKIVRWDVQVISVQRADPLRRGMTPDEPYLLARGPLPETGFLYVAITNDEAEVFHRLEPLAKIRIRATIRAGKSRFLPTPVLNFVRRLD